MKPCAFIVLLAGLLCLLTPAPAHAIVPQRPHKPVASDTQAAIRKAPKAPKQDQVHPRGVDGTIAMIHLISSRRQHETPHKDQAVPHGSDAQVRASAKDAEPRSRAALTARSVESLPPHRESTHLCI